MKTWVRSLYRRSQLLASRRASNRVVLLIAERSLAAAREQLSANTSHMRTAELNGYVQARAHRIVREQARNAAMQRGLPVSSFEGLVLPALQRTAQLIARQPRAQAIMPLPAPHVQLRIAG
jgi:hypothetical protein